MTTTAQPETTNQKKPHTAPDPKFFFRGKNYTSQNHRGQSGYY